MRRPVAQLSVLSLGGNGDWYAFLWYLTAPLVVLRPFVILVQVIQQGVAYASYRALTA